MKRRTFLLTSGSGVLAGATLSGLQRPAFGLDFELTSVPDRKPKNIDSIQIDFSRFNLTPQYVDDSEDATVNIRVVIGSYSESISKSVSFTNGSSVKLSDLRPEIPISVDNINTSKVSVDGEIQITVEHKSIGTETYNQTFEISDNPLINGLVAYYPIENNGSDVIIDGSGDHISQTNGSGWTNDSIVGNYSYDFTGASSGATVLDSPELRLSKTKTLSTWFKSNQSDEGVLLMKGERVEIPLNSFSHLTVMGR